MGIGRYFTLAHNIKFDIFKYRYRKANKDNNTIPGNYLSMGIENITLGNNNTPEREIYLNNSPQSDSSFITIDNKNVLTEESP